MAGRARFHALKGELEKRTRETFEDDPNATHLDFVCEWLECGRTAKELCRDLELTLNFEFTYARLMAYLREAFGDTETEQRMDTARALSSHALAEDSLTIVDQEAYSNIDVARAASRARTRQWMAERYNPGRFGQNKGVNVNVSIGSLHLTAMKAVSGDAGKQQAGTSAVPILPAPARIIATQVVRVDETRSSASEVTPGAPDNTEPSTAKTQLIGTQRDSETG